MVTTAVVTGVLVLHCRADLLLGDGFGSPDEDCQGVDAHQDGHRQQNGSNDLHSVIRALHAHNNNNNNHNNNDYD